MSCGYWGYNNWCHNVLPPCQGGTIIGGWNIDIKDPRYINYQLYQCFMSALSSQIGVTYEILLYLGYQLVNGTNYALLCKETTVTNPPTTRLVVAVINRDLNGVCTVVSVNPVFE